MKDLEKVYVECSCDSDEHTLRYTFSIYDNKDQVSEDPVIYTSVYLNDWDPWYKRVWKAVKYVFGYRCKYGHWDTTSMNPMDAMKLRKLLEEFAVFVAENPECLIGKCDEEQQILVKDAQEIAFRKRKNK